MERLHTMLRAIRATKARGEHLDVFRAFLSGLAPLSRRPPARAPSAMKRRKTGARRKAK